MREPGPLVQPVHKRPVKFRLAIYPQAGYNCKTNG